MKKKNKSLWKEKIKQISVLNIEDLVNKSFKRELKNINFYLNLFLKGRMIRIEDNFGFKNKKEFNVKTVNVTYDGFNINIEIKSTNNEEFILNNEKIRILL